MNVIIVVDKRGYLAFNGRRLSQDKKLVENLQELCQKKDLCLNVTEYTAQLLNDYSFSSTYLIVDDLSRCKEKDWILVELEEPKDLWEKLLVGNEIVLYNWNRAYPGDRKFSLQRLDESWEKVETIDFEGSSHEKITREIWRKIQ